MFVRHLTGHPQITFTLDFHELVTGNAAPGKSITLRYDPKRIVPPGAPYRFGDPSQPVIASVGFLPGGDIIEQTLQSPIGQPGEPDVDITGQGSMLIGRIDVPAQCHELAIWFRWTAPDGTVHWDSDGGKNHHLRFPAYDVHPSSAGISEEPGNALATLAVEVAAMSEIDSMSVRYRLVNDPQKQFERRTAAMTRGEADPEDEARVIWSASRISLPFGSTVAFDLVYTVSGRTFKDDNAGRYFLAASLAPV